MDKVNKLYSEVFACRQCREFSEHHKFSPGCHGRGKRGLMIVGESSHKPSIDAGRYYANGPIRFLLTGVVDLERDCFLSDAIKCDKQFCSAKGKSLEKVAERCCAKFLSQEVALLQPRAIVAVGRIAFEMLTGITDNYVTRQNDGKRYFVTNLNIPVHPVVHPSNANRLYGSVPWQSVPYVQNVAEIVRSCL